jgi:CubicO group peptidase (beta-lactamase class C family)
MNAKGGLRLAAPTWAAVALVLAYLPGMLAAAELDAVPLTAGDLNVWLDGYMPHALETADIAGAVVAVVKDGEILSERGFGYADVAKHTPVDPRLTLFRPGSVSKLFTWTAVMQLVEQGKIDLDADVNAYLDFRIPPRDGKPVTMRNLMQHTAGFEEQAKGIISEDPTGPGFVALLKQWVPARVFAPGGTPAYSNYGASLAGYIVQRVSGEPFPDYIEKHIFAPLQMQHSSFRQPLPAALAPLMSKGYRVASAEPHPFEIIGPAPAGSMSSPGEDMAHFMIAHLQGGEYHGNRILSAATAAMMHDSPLTLLAPLNRMELGFFETNVNGREVIGHLGDTEYFHTSLHLFVSENVGLYVSFNSAGQDGAAGSLRSALFDDFADRYFPAQKPLERVAATTAARHALLLQGSWSNSRGSQSNFLAALGFVGQVKVGVDAKGHLVLPFHGVNGQPRQWTEISPFLWQDLDGHERLAAKVVDGKAVRFSIDLLSPFMVFERVPWYQDATWLLPLLLASLAALLITALQWPIAAIVRRRFGATLALDRSSLLAFRGSKIGAMLLVAGGGLWAALLTWLMKDLGNLTAKSDAVLYAVELFGIVAFAGGAVLIAWNLWAVWSRPRRWPARLWSIVLSIAAATVLWVGLTFHLMSVGSNY